MRELELLAPARDAATAIEAIRHGADAVYMGASAFGARAAAGNSVSDIACVCDYAHRFGAKVYVTVNTIIYEYELEEVAELVHKLYIAGVDALIVQDMALLRMQLPPIDLHASTQCDVRTPAKADFLYRAGFSRVVLARELSADEISAVRAATEAELEVFVHGALCVSYSGDCHAGAVLTGRSANRGECPQICRLRYSLTDDQGKPVAHDGHWLSLRDLNRLEQLERLARAGACSFKIEGRLKDQAYVKNVVAAYSKKLDELVARYPDEFRRASYGKVEVGFEADVRRSFNRGFTSYFLDATPVLGASGLRKSAVTGMASSKTPKWLGQPLGTVISCSGQRLKLRTTVSLANGDGIVWFGADGRLAGARVNRVEGHEIQTVERLNIPAGTQVYRNRDKAWDDQLARKTARRAITVEMHLRPLADGRIALDAADCRGVRVTATMAAERQPARTPQAEARRALLGRLGDDYELGCLDDSLGDTFIPASQLTTLRRQAIELLEQGWSLQRRPRKRLREQPYLNYGTAHIDYHGNVANSLARQFYKSHGVAVIEPAIELGGREDGEKRVMTTRYCLRRELGRCIRQGHKPGSWYLRATDGAIALRVDFDCANCCNRIVKENKLFNKE